MASRSVEQSQRAFTDYNQAAQVAVSTFDQWIEASQIGTQDISKRAMKFAQRNVLSAFDFAEKIVQAKDINELIRMQTEFVQWQIQFLSEQIKDLGETAANAAKAAVWQFLRQNALPSCVFKSYDDIVDHCCCAWNALLDPPWHVHPPPRLGEIDRLFLETDVSPLLSYNVGPGSGQR